MRQITKFALLIATLAVTACGDTVTEFDPVTTEATAEAVLSQVEANPALQSLSVLGPALAFAGGGAASVVAPMEQGAEELRDAVVRFATAAPQALFPEAVLGRTLVYNPETESYEIDADRTGAPANGVRFILYAVDPILHQVVTPLNEIGMLDLIDESTATSNRVGITATVSGSVVLDYHATGTLGGGGVTLTVDGFLTDGSDQLDFDLAITASQSAVTIDYFITNGTSSIGFIGSVGASTTVAMTLTEGDAEVTLAFTSSGTSISGDITHNGQVVVTITGNPENPTFTHADGRQLTGEEIAALHALGAVMEHFFALVDALLAPAHLVFLGA